MLEKRARPRHRAERTRRWRLPGLVSLVSGLAVTAAGSTGLAVTTPQPAAQSVITSHVRTGTDATGRTDTRLESRRELAVSRDSAREALQDSAGARLSPAGELQQREQNAGVKALSRQAEVKAGQLPKNSWHLPTRGYHLTARFGQAGGHWVSNHTGLDFAAPTGTPIFAVAGGMITGTGWAGSYGNRTVETLPDGTELWYAHQSSIGVKVGQQVVGGQTIGAVGSTGNTTGPHVHLEVRPGGGDPVDPYQALIVHGVHP